MPEVLGHQAPHEGPVVRQRRVDHLLVLLCLRLEHAGFDKLRETGEARATAQLTDHLDEVVVAVEGEEGEMELGVDQHVCREVTFRRRRNDAAGQRSQRLYPASDAQVPVAGDRDHRRHLDQRPQLGQLVEGRVVHRRHPKTLVAHGLEEALVGQVEQRFANRGGRDAELRRQPGDGAQGPGLELPGDEEPAHDLGDLVAQARPRLDGADDRGRS